MTYDEKGNSVLKLAEDDDPVRPHSALVHGKASADVNYAAFKVRKFDKQACDARAKLFCRKVHEEIETLIGLVRAPPRIVRSLARGAQGEELTEICALALGG